MAVNRNRNDLRRRGVGQAMRALAGTVAAGLAGGTAGADDLSYKPHSVEAPDGVTLAVQEWGNAEGPAIVFVHGFSASHLASRKQVDDPQLADAFRMVTFDPRGSGISEKPADAEFYQQGERHADDIAAIIDELVLDKPVLVSWSAGVQTVPDNDPGLLQYSRSILQSIPAYRGDFIAGRTCRKQ